AVRIAVMGAGGLGGYYGAMLARAGEDVTFVDQGAHLDAITAKGLTVKLPNAEEFTLDAKATNDPSKIGTVDLVLFCVKTYFTYGAAEQIRPIVVLSLQNGIDNRERIGRVVGPEAVMCGVTAISSAVDSPGVVVHRGGLTSITFGELDGDSTSRIQRLQNTFQCPGIGANISSNILADMWEGYLAICGFGGVTALTRLPIGPVLAYEETKAFLRGALVEVFEVALASGVCMPEDCVDRWLAYMETFPPETKGSIGYDLAAGRSLELETLNGTVVRLGRKYGINTPFNFVIYAGLKPFADGTPDTL
ncbi:MAG: ketopantoate reductase family protein, partial [Dehalococcoidia bacterium]